MREEQREPAKVQEHDGPKVGWLLGAMLQAAVDPGVASNRAWGAKVGWGPEISLQVQLAG